MKCPIARRRAKQIITQTEVAQRGWIFIYLMYRKAGWKKRADQNGLYFGCFFLLAE